MFTTPTPPSVVVVETPDLERQDPVSASSELTFDEKHDDKKKKKDAGVVVSVLSIGDATVDSPAVTPRTSVININTVLGSGAQLDEKHAKEVEEDEVFPEGGLRAWSVVLGAWCGMFGSMG